jgi:hypothetical protein
VSKPLRVEDVARNELRAIVAWYEGRRSGLGGDFFADVERMLQLIQRHGNSACPSHGCQSNAERGAYHSVGFLTQSSTEKRIRNPDHCFRP